MKRQRMPNVPLTGSLSAICPILPQPDVKKRRVPPAAGATGGTRMIGSSPGRQCNCRPNEWSSQSRKRLVTDH